MKFLQHKYVLISMGSVASAIAGYIYWYYWGCTEGCTIRSIWWRMSLWAGLMGGILASMLHDYLAKRSKS